MSKDIEFAQNEDVIGTYFPYPGSMRPVRYV